MLINTRKNRKLPWIRELLAETRLQASDLIMPFFVIKGKGQRKKILTLSGQYRLSVDLLLEEIQKAKDLGIVAIMLFPVIEDCLKTVNGDEAINRNNLICQAVREIKEKISGIGVICDVALDPYTVHGQDGLLSKNGDYVLNDETVKILCQQALVQARAGCDIIAPSDMMDGRVGAIRKCLDENGFEWVGIMSYAAKYASNFYGPFRNAIGSNQNLIADKKNYQMDFRNAIEAQREISLDISEGVDMIIIKPGSFYLDIVVKARQNCDLPIISYQVSGEYAMLKLAAREGLFDFNDALYESLIAFKRAGARAIISYGAMEMATELRNRTI